MVHAGVIRRSDEEFSDVIRSGISAVVDMVVVGLKVDVDDDNGGKFVYRVPAGCLGRSQICWMDLGGAVGLVRATITNPLLRCGRMESIGDGRVTKCSE